MKLIQLHHHHYTGNQAS